MPPATQADCGWKAILQLLAPHVMTVGIPRLIFFPLSFAPDRN